MAKKKMKSKSKRVVKSGDVIDSVAVNVTPATLNAPTPPIMPVFLKVCRLCESKDGPFLNIFDADGMMAKKIDDLMPFNVTENDDLPHKICFRCSAKLEELYEFIQKCIRTQESLCNAVGKSGPLITKSKMGKKLWEDKLNKSNMSNDDICDALIKKAMEGIKGVPLSSIIKEDGTTETKQIPKNKEPVTARDTVSDTVSEFMPDDNDEATLKEVKNSLGKCDPKPSPSKRTRSSKLNATEIETPPTGEVESVETNEVNRAKQETSKRMMSKKQETSGAQSSRRVTPQKAVATNNLGNDPSTAPIPIKDSSSDEEKQVVPEKPFNIMDHISMIKVNGVGILFQCKLCNRNFLKIDVVENHSCAKNGVPKTDLPRPIPAPEPPKVPSVKYIKINTEMKKSLTEKVKLAETTENNKNVSLESSVIEQEAPKAKPKPKAGPASKTKRKGIDSDSVVSQTPVTNTEAPSTQPLNIPVSQPLDNSLSNVNPSEISTMPSVQLPNLPNINGRFKLVPGPNNIFSLVEDTSTSLPSKTQVTSPSENKRPNRKRKRESTNDTETTLTDLKASEMSEVIDLEDPSKPYPVGLFQTVSHPQPTPPTFTTPAMKKQSYTIVPTGDPSKLLISTKAQVVEKEITNKRQRKSKHEVKKDLNTKEPYTVTLEDIDPPKDSGFFSFINVDPLLQPSYVLPTNNIIQESQISTSSSVLNKPSDSKEKEVYSCNMCDATFSREKKLLAHIQSHFTAMDKEDAMRSPSKRRTKK